MDMSLLVGILLTRTSTRNDSTHMKLICEHNFPYPALFLSFLYATWNVFVGIYNKLDQRYYHNYFYYLFWYLFTIMTAQLYLYFIEMFSTF